ncbi:MAG TPA: cytochrome c biogenesis protein CcsA [Thermodesulfobacteriota bacterium]|nr:cytochrome c biogenesis protein CcsA [Thermodesulfobacteriota bacterium]
MAFGGYVIWITLVFEILTLLYYIFNQKQIARYSYIATTVLGTVATVQLFYFFVVKDFSVEYVAAFCSNDLSLFYTISAFWAGQQGSFLLWLFLALVMGIFLFRTDEKWQQEVMIFYNVQILALLVLLLKQNPFKLSAQIPPDGTGLNPLLINPWMAIHPPMMFLGYAAYGVMFAFIIAALWKKDISTWIDVSIRWIVFAWLTLGIGIILGGYWAYETLGWGGYWGWDPVENASFIPWLFGTALLHGLAIQRIYKGFYKSNALLAIFSYLFIIYGTFLTRSGILADFSVHSFVDLGITGWLAFILLVFLAGSIALYFLRRDIFPKGEPIKGFLRPPTLLALSVILLVLSGLVVTVGTSAPLITRIWSKPAQVDIPFYVNTQIPIYMVLLLVFTLFAYKKKFLPFVIVGSVLVPAISYSLGVHNVVHLVLIALCTSTLVSQLGNKRVFFILIHSGVALFILGSIYATGYDKQVKLTLQQDMPVKVDDKYTITFRSFAPPSPQEKPVATLEVNDGKKTYVVKPKLWFNQKSNQLVANPHIRIHFAMDEYYVVHQYKPAVQPSGILAMRKGETKDLGDVRLSFLGFKLDQSHMGNAGMMVRAVLAVDGDKGKLVMPAYELLPGGVVNKPEVDIPGHNAKVKLEAMDATTGTIHLNVISAQGVAQKATAVVEFTRVPLISIVWIGSILQILGCTISLMFRHKKVVVAKVQSPPQREQQKKSKR